MDKEERITRQLFQIFKTAVEEERKAQNMYRDAMEICMDDVLKGVLNGFYEDEVRHEHELREQYERLRRMLGSEAK